MEFLVIIFCVYFGVRKVFFGVFWCWEDDVGFVYSYGGGGFVFWLVGLCIWEEEENFLEVGLIFSGSV